MTRLTQHLTLKPDDAIDLHMHTTYSDGRWTAQQVIDYLVTEQYALVAITDHDRVDKIAEIQELAAQKQLPVLAGVEISTDWHGRLGHMLCYGFDPANNSLGPLTEKVVRQQLENTYEVHEELCRQGYAFPRQEEVLAANGGALNRPSDNMLLLREHGYAANSRDALHMIQKAGFRSILANMAETVEQVHQSGAVCLLAHPGRRGGEFTFYDPALLDQLRAKIPIDGIEVYHPYHSSEIIEAYLAYVQQHDLLLSTGSDSHYIPGRMPIKHRAEVSQRLLACLGVTVV